MVCIKERHGAGRQIVVHLMRWIRRVHTRRVQDCADSDPFLKFNGLGAFICLPFVRATSLQRRTRAAYPTPEESELAATGPSVALNR
jgi:hypothetical protein